MPSIADIKQQYPDLTDLDDDQIVDVLHSTFYPDRNRQEVADRLGVKPPPEPVAPRGLLRTAGDLGISAIKGAIGVPEAVVGLADMATGGQAGKMAENIGFRPKEAKAILDEQYSPQQKAAFQKVQAADGFIDTFKAAVQNPSVIAQSVVESIPSMGAGGVFSRGVMALAPKAGAVVAGALGEGVIGAGSAAEQIRQNTNDGLLTGTQSGLAMATGATTTGFALLGGKLAKRLGIADVDTMMAGAATYPQMRKGIVRSALEGAVAEGLLEELPQSVSEQVLQNIALDKPLDEGVNQAAVLGLLSGGAMGGGANVVQSFSGKPNPVPPPTGGGLERAAANVAPGTAEAMAAQSAPPVKEPPPAVDPVDDPIAGRIQALPEGPRQEAERAYAVLNNPEAQKGVQNYNKKLLDRLLSQEFQERIAETKQAAGDGLSGDRATQNVAVTQKVDPTTGEITSAYDQRQADAPKQEDGDILNAENKPFTNLAAAKKTALALGDGFAPIKLKANAFVVRKRGEPDVSTSSSVSPGSAVTTGGGTDNANSGVAAGLGNDGTDERAVVTGSEKPDAAGGVVSPAGGADDKAVDVKNTPPVTRAKAQAPASQATKAGAPVETGATAAGAESGSAAVETAGVKTADLRSKAWDREQNREPNTSDREANLITSLTSFSGATERWDERRVTGMTDDDLKAAIGQEFGAMGSGPFANAAAGGPEPRFWHKADGSMASAHGTPTLKGKALIQEVRRVLGIGAPKGDSTETEPAQEAAGLAAAEQSLADAKQELGAVDTKAAAAKLIPDMSNAELLALKDYYKPENRRAAKIAKEIEKRSIKPAVAQAEPEPPATKNVAKVEGDDKPVKKAPYVNSWEFNGSSDFEKGNPRVLPSYFTDKTGANAKAWYRGWDKANAAAPVEAPAAPKPQIMVDKAEMRPYRKPDGSVGYEAVPIQAPTPVEAISTQKNPSPDSKTPAALATHSEWDGKKVVIEITADDGSKASMTFDAGKELRAMDKREKALVDLKACLGRKS